MAKVEHTSDARYRVSGLYGGFANHTTEETGYGQG